MDALCVCVVAMEAELEHWIGQKLFILVSSVLTWAKSKPLDPVREPCHLEQVGETN